MRIKIYDPLIWIYTDPVLSDVVTVTCEISYLIEGKESYTLPGP